MNWEALGAISGLVEALAVICTLIYLAVQIRQFTRSQQSATAQATGSSRTALYELGASDPELSRVYAKGLAHPDELTDEERTRFMWMLARVFATFEETYSQYKLKLVEENDWERYRQTARTMIENPVTRDWWESGAAVFTGSFIHDITPDLDITAWTPEIYRKLMGKSGETDDCTERTRSDG